MIILRQFFRQQVSAEIFQTASVLQFYSVQKLHSSTKVVKDVDRAYATNAADSSSLSVSVAKTVKEEEITLGPGSVSKAMKDYLQRSQEYETFRKKEITKYEIGKRHLANMMGEDPETFNQDDIDNAIQYLLPSGLFMKRARPHMKHPLELFPDKKAVEFDEAGRPYHCLFYTMLPSYHELLQDIAIKAKKLDLEEDRIIRQKEEFKKPLNLSSSCWVKKVKLEDVLKETLRDSNYEFFSRTMDRLSSHPCSYLEEEFILKFSVPLDDTVEKAGEIPKLMYNEKGDPYMTAVGKRRTSIANVTVTGNGTGKVEVEGQNLLFFENLQDREQILFPLQFTNSLQTVDVTATVESGGFAGQAGAIRHGISLALMSFVDEKIIEYMRLAGLLTWDRRFQARKVYGRKGARARYTWKKR